MANQQVKTGLGTAVILIFAVTAGVFVWFYEKSQLEISISTKNDIQKNTNNSDKIYSVDDLVNSDLEDGSYVKVKGIPGRCVFIEWSSPLDMNPGGGSGCYLGGDNKSILIGDSKDPLLSIEKYQKYQGEIVVSGKIRGCAKEKNYCRLDDVKFISNIGNSEGWQTYRNEEYGFEVKLPGDWKAYSEYDGSVIASSPNKFPANPTILTGTPPTLDFQIGFIEDGKLNNSEGKSIKIKSGENGIETMNEDKVFFAVQLRSGLLSISSNKDYSQNDIIFSSISIIK